MSSKYYTKLIKFDKGYFAAQNWDRRVAGVELVRARVQTLEPIEKCYAYKISTEEELCYGLATWAFDNDFDVDERSWEMLDKIQLHFNMRIRNRVLHNLFIRRHDT